MTRQEAQHQGKDRRLPEFHSREEMAAWFDTHDTAAYEAEFRPVQVRFAKNLSEGLHIRLDPASLTQLRETAHQQGIGPTTLARMWILEHLREQERRPAP
ncbi:MAG: BrnA antitoxin family protein [Chloroflexi bacterium]|nr:BrnA antitoxin family protein [Chloroflexota bacterium]